MMETIQREIMGRMSGLQVPWMTMSQWSYAEAFTNYTYPERPYPDMALRPDAQDAMILLDEDSNLGKSCITIQTHVEIASWNI